MTWTWLVGLAHEAAVSWAAPSRMNRLENGEGGHLAENRCGEVRMLGPFKLQQAEQVDVPAQNELRCLQSEGSGGNSR